jgi:hypothetical protein
LSWSFTPGLGFSPNSTATTSPKSPRRTGLIAYAGKFLRGDGHVGILPYVIKDLTGFPRAVIDQYDFDSRNLN